MKKLNPEDSSKSNRSNKIFDFFRAQSQTKVDMRDDPDFEKLYLPYLADIHFSLFIDTLMDADRMNRQSGLGSISKESHFLYYLNKVKPRKRFAGKWPKSKRDEMIGLIREYYGYSIPKARQALACLSDKQINEIKRRTKKGGIE